MDTAGGRRIALRSGGVLSWLLGDHLGGTAVTVSGTTETGEVRYGSNSSWGRPTFREGVGDNYRLRRGRLTPSRKVGRRCGYYLPQP